MLISIYSSSLLPPLPPSEFSMLTQYPSSEAAFYWKSERIFIPPHSFVLQLLFWNILANSSCVFHHSLEAEVVSVPLLPFSLSLPTSLQLFYAQRGTKQHRKTRTCLQPGADKECKKEKMEAVDFVGVMEFWGLRSFSLTISFVQETISFSEYD